MASIKYARTASGAISVQVVRKRRGATEVLKHVGSARTDAELALLTDQARAFMGTDQQLSLDLGLDVPEVHYPRMDDFSAWTDHSNFSEHALFNLPAGSKNEPISPVHAGPRVVRRGGPSVVATPALTMWQVLARVYDDLGLSVIDDATFQAVVLARIVEPTAKSKVPDVMADLGQHAMHPNTVYNALTRCIKRDYRQKVEQVCHHYVREHHQVTMVLYDVTTLHFETPKEDDSKKVGMSNQRRIDPQIVVGLITDATGFPLHVEHFHGKTAETTTLIPMIQAYMNAHDIATMTVVADAAMLSAANLDALDAAGIDYIVADRLKKAPYLVPITNDDLAEWSKQTADYHVIESTKTMGDNTDRRTRRTVLAFSPKRYTYDVYSLAKQKEKAEAVAAGRRPAKQVRFVRKAGGEYVVNTDAYDKALALAGWKGYVTSLDKNQVPGADVIAFYHELYHIERAFRMAKTDLKARPIHATTDERIHAHFTVVMAALAISRHIYEVTGTTAPKLVEQLITHRHAVLVNRSDFCSLC